jgi:hypothetical protein
MVRPEGLCPRKKFQRRILFTSGSCYLCCTFRNMEFCAVLHRKYNIWHSLLVFAYLLSTLYIISWWYPSLFIWQNMNHIMNYESTLQMVSWNHHRSAFAWRWCRWCRRWVCSDSSSPLPFSPFVRAGSAFCWILSSMESLKGSPLILWFWHLCIFLHNIKPLHHPPVQAALCQFHGLLQQG